MGTVGGFVLVDKFACNRIKRFVRGSVIRFARGSVIRFARGRVEGFARCGIIGFARGRIIRFARGRVERFARGRIERFARGRVERFARGGVQGFAHSRRGRFAWRVNGVEIALLVDTGIRSRKRPGSRAEILQGPAGADIITVGSEGSADAEGAARLGLDVLDQGGDDVELLSAGTTPEILGLVGRRGEVLLERGRGLKLSATEVAGKGATVP
ncbi:hypothetical protein BC938DRAFT_476918 [Jimgerdemannia flammicorona]|nr:hypothetical protein BC938DRAFT_476918 [Jimgerdemannia flammicorona]